MMPPRPRVALFGGSHVGQTIAPPPNASWAWIAWRHLVYERVAPDVAVWFGNRDDRTLAQGTP